uniref:Protein-serine/threonine phosphatase n=1 Tax=Mesocestoides corti TaxID=53468 RepID=A0A5K3ENN2_MESCO
MDSLAVVHHHVGQRSVRLMRQLRNRKCPCFHEPRQKAFKNVRPTTTGCRSDSHEPPNYWSDPPVSDEYADLREFNTCPEGYDYVDAEQARELLRPETTRKSPTTKQADVGGGGGNYGGKKKPVIGAAGYLEVSLFGSEISSSSSESDSGGDDSDGDAVIKSDALKEFM